MDIYIQRFCSLQTTQSVLQHMLNSPFPTYIHTLMTEAMCDGTSMFKKISQPSEAICILPKDT